MSSFAKKVKTNSVVTALIYFLLGLVLLIWPGTATNVLNTALGLVLAVIGAADIVMFLVSRDGTLYSSSRLVVGAALVVFGIWLLIRPELLAIIIPRVIGALICVHGIADVGNAVTLHKNEYARWTAALIIGILTVILGVILIFRPLGAFQTVLRIIGAFLIFDSLSDLWIISRVSSTLKRAQKDAEAEADAVDADYRDVSENTSGDDHSENR